VNSAGGLIFAGALLLSGALLFGCGSKKVSQEDLLRRNFALVEVNGEPFTGEKIPNLQFDGDFRVSGVICNSYAGQAELVGDILYVRQLASTKMLCFDQKLNELEFTFGNMLMNGARLKSERNSLTLMGEGQSLLFEPAD
jgi:heat shock protein HslJ